MSEAGALLEKCRALGISLRPGEGGKLKVSPPPERLPGELVEELRHHKAEVLALLTQGQQRPYLTPTGELIIPCDCDPRYRWWAGGQSIAETLAELNAPPEMWRRYVAGYTETMQ